MAKETNNIAKAAGLAAAAAGLLLLVCETPGLGLAGVKAAGALLAALGSRVIVKADPAVEEEEV